MLINVADIRKNDVALRTVNKESEQYLNLLASIKEHGVLQSILVQKQFDPDGKEYYLLVDGLQRFSCCLDAGLEKVEANVQEFKEPIDIYIAQIVTNIQRVDTKPMDVTNGLRRILTANPMMTESDLGRQLGQSAAYIQQRLSLTKIENQRIKDAINNGDIKLMSAYALAKLPPEEQINFLTDAMTKDPIEFSQQANQRAKEIKEAKREGRKVAPVTWEPIAHLQRLQDIKAEVESLENIGRLINGIKKPIEAAKITLQWVLHLDAESITIAREKYEATMKAKEEAKERRKVEKLAEAASEEAAAAAIA